MREYISWVIAYLNSVKVDMLLWVACIIGLSILQKYHYLMLHYMKKNSYSIINFIISFIIRLGVIIHEFSHLIFGFIFGVQITEIRLFDKDGGKVNFKIPDFIGSLGHTKMGIWFFIRLIINRFGVFLISSGPLLVGIGINTLLFYFIQNIPNEIYFNILKRLIILVYSIFFLQSYILSFQDISNLVLYRGTNIFATIIGSIINILVFLLFLVLVSNYTIYLTYFILFYGTAFLVTVIVFLLFIAFKKIKTTNKST